MRELITRKVMRSKNAQCNTNWTNLILNKSKLREVLYCWQIIVILLILRPIVLFVLKIVLLAYQSLGNIERVMDETSNAVDKIWWPPLIPEVFSLSPENKE